MTHPEPSERPTTQEILQVVRQVRQALRRPRAANAAAHDTPNAKVDAPPPRIASNQQAAAQQRSKARQQQRTLHPFHPTLAGQAVGAVLAKAANKDSGSAAAVCAVTTHAPLALSFGRHAQGATYEAEEATFRAGTAVRALSG